MSSRLGSEKAVQSNGYCIIGGGAIGIGVAKCLMEAGIDCEIIEAEDDFGGNWYFSSEAGRVYRSAHLISSKTNTQLSDFPMPEDYPSYPNHEQMLKYLRQIAEAFGLYDRVRFSTRVERV